MAEDKDTIRVSLLLSVIWLAGAVVDCVWLSLDHNVPSWDQAQYLTGSLNYWRALQHPQWFSNEWWTSFWMLSSKIPPLIYITAGVFQHLFGIGPDQAILIQLLFSAILIGSVYGLGRQLFSAEVGLWAAGLCQLVPGLYRYKIEFLLDYPLAALVTLSFWCLTVWIGSAKHSVKARTEWFWAVAFGLSFGLAMMVKQPALLFLFTPVVWVGVEVLRRRQWGRLVQLIVGLCLSVVIFGPWYRTNWLIILTAGKRATIDSAVAKGDAPLNTLKAWTYYWQATPHQISWLLLLVPIVGLLLYWGRLVSRGGEGVRSKELKSPQFTPQIKSLGWLAIFWAGGYLLSSLNINKDDRYVLPYLPAISIALAYGLTCWRRPIRFWTAGLAVMLMFLNLFPVGGVLGSGLTQVLSPDAQHRPYLGPPWPHRQVIEEIIQTEPYLSSTLGVVPSTGQINQHNFNYYGALRHFQVYGRQVGVKTKQVLQDARSLSWFLTKTGDQGSVRRGVQDAMVQAVERSPDLQLHKTWNLPDGNTLNLYHTRVPLVQVQPLSKSEDLGGRSKEYSSLPKVRLEQVIVPNRVPPGVPVPVTYQWSGPWQQLQSGLVLLTWHQNSRGDPPGRPYHRWLHDHGIGMGTLYPSNGDSASRPYSRNSSLYLVTEQMAMLPPADIASGSYTLEATYLNRHGESYSIPVPPTTLSIAPESATVLAPELDLVTQLRTLAAGLPNGTKAVGPIFEEIGRINQYDPLQDYVVQAQLAFQHRIQQEPQNRDWAYGLALTKVLKRQVKGAITALEHVTQLDAQNPYAYAYLAFIHLYDWQPSAAEIPLKSAAALNPNLSEVHALIGAKALMQGNLLEAWHALWRLKIKRSQGMGNRA